jgi:predicted transcriptional regulator
MIATPDAQGDEPVLRRALLLSLRPRFATAILDGSKTVELRRTRIAALPGTLLVLYASSPIMAVVGTAILLDRHTASPSTIWRTHRVALGLERGEFFEYLAGADQATAITIGNPQALPDPFTLAWLRDHAGFQPPQSYRYIAPSDPAPLHNLAAAYVS